VVVDPDFPDPDAIAQVAQVIRDGGVAAMPTDTLYGLAANPYDAASVGRVFHLKGRSAAQALPLVAADLLQVRTWFGELPPIAARLAEHFWPGPLTLVIAAPPTLTSEVTGDRATVGVRVPAHAVTRALCAACGHPLTATSANISGTPATTSPDDVARQLGDGLAVLLDAGSTPGGPASTIVDVTTTDPRLIRAGAISWDDIQACLSRT
jgi:L-threonylcarbamoyladenylate synthase